jgi:uncharacterized protein (DUF849 family)
MSAAVLTAALTGPIATKADNPYLPTTPDEIAAEAEAAANAGASVIHVHLRDTDGNPTADLEIAPSHRRPHRRAHRRAHPAFDRRRVDRPL